MPARTDEVYYFVILMKLIKPEQLFPLKRYKFENHEFWGPNDSDALLTQAYGDYMSIPEYDDRRPHYSNVSYTDPTFDYNLNVGEY